MASSTSFGVHHTNRPPHYRTPSPPRHAIEPLSPRSAFAPPSACDPAESLILNGRGYPLDAASPGDGSRKQSLQRFSIDSIEHPQVQGIPPDLPLQQKPQQQSPPGRPGGHSRSRSSIDTLATIALATSPTFSPLVYDGPDLPTPVLPLVKDAAPVDRDERPSKRAKSEKAVSPSWQRFGNRPATSHTSTLDSIKTDAELLLNFARPANGPLLHPPMPYGTDSAHSWKPAPWRGQPSAVSSVLENRGPVAWMGTGGFNGAIPSVRLRSQSDGAAALSRPAIDALIPDSFIYLPNTGPVLEDDQEEDEVQAGPEVHKAVAWDQAKPPIDPSPSEQPPISGPEVKHEHAPNASSSGLTTCGACNQVRIPVEAGGGDDAEVTWINCDGCDRWFHIFCCGFKTGHELRTVDKFICPQCRPVYGPTTFVRKSTRPRTAIDYAGLNQGFVKPPSEENENLHITSIKQGLITFLPDHFARMPPDLVTASYFERGAGMMEPIVIPAHMNPRHPCSAPDFSHEATTEEEFDASIPEDNGYEEAVDCGQDLLDMVIPKHLTVKAVGEIYGPEEKIEVIDVKSQQGEEKKWNMQRWMDYYYDTNSAKVVKNVISLEVSQSPLGRLLRRPRVVRDLDLQDSVWPPEQQAIGDYPKVQFYCLMSVADCYTDFHIDFGGSSVYYHILKGKKTFFFIPPKEKHLKKYDEWCNSPAQDTTFLGTESKECYRVDLSEGDTMLIPSGWIHAVWTPEDSLVIGGNFLTRMNYAMQLKITKMEKDAKVPRKFRYPFFQKIMWLTTLKYLSDDPLPPRLQEAFGHDENYQFPRETPIYHPVADEAAAAHEPGSDHYNAKYYSQGEIDGLPELAKYILRTALIAGGYKVDGVSKETKNAVSRSIPKGQGDPVEIAQKFGVWVAWKRGNEPAPQWTRPGAIVMDVKVDMSDKRRSSRPRKQSERAMSISHKRKNSPNTPQSSDRNSQAPNGTPLRSVSISSGSGTPVQVAHRVSVSETKGRESSPHQPSKSASLGPKRIACEPCRKRRIKCRHKDGTLLDAGSNELELAKDSGNHPAFSVSDTPLLTELEIPPDLAGENNNIFPSMGESSMPRLPNANGEILKRNQETSPGSPFSSKKGRIKACEECRKSKRRCIHDEAGRIDPIKIQEQPKPKRSRPDDGNPTSQKKPKLTEEASLLNPDTSASGKGLDTGTKGARDKPGKPRHVSKSGFPRKSPLYSSPPAGNSETDPSPEHTMAPEVVQSVGSLVSPPTSLVDDIDGVLSSLDGEKNKTVDGERKSDKPLSIHTPTSISYHPSNYAPSSGDAAAVDNVKRRQSKDLSATAVSISGMSPSSPVRSKAHSRPGSSHRANDHGPGLKRAHDRTSFAEVDADPDSIKLIRQLQEEDFGLRRRAAKPKQ